MRDGRGAWGGMGWRRLVVVVVGGGDVSDAGVYDPDGGWRMLCEWDEDGY